MLVGSHCIIPLKKDRFPFWTFKAQLPFTTQFPDGVDRKELIGPEIIKLFPIGIFDWVAEGLLLLLLMLLLIMLLLLLLFSILPITELLPPPPVCDCFCGGCCCCGGGEKTPLLLLLLMLLPLGL